MPSKPNRGTAGRATSVLFLASAFALAGTPGYAQQGGGSPGALFTMSNGVNQNQIVMYTRAADGTLTPAGQIATGGRGSGGTVDPLESQYPLVLTANHEFLLAVNAGTSDISVFKVSGANLTLVGTTPSGGSGPISLAVHGNLVYVVNYTGTYHTAGFQLSSTGALTPIAGSRQVLSTMDTGASTVAFSPDGSKLVISERLTNKIDVFSVSASGVIANPVFNNSAGSGPFGLTFTPSGTLLVTEVNGGPPNPGTTSSYMVNADNTLTPISARIHSGGLASCWIATQGSLAWVSDTATGNLGGLAISGSGALTALGTEASPAPGSTPLELGLTPDGRYLYVLYVNLGGVVGYITASDGSLTEVSSVHSGVPAQGEIGLAVY